MLVLGTVETVFCLNLICLKGKKLNEQLDNWLGKA